VYEWMNPAHGNVSIILHVLGYAGGMIALFLLARYAMVARNMLAQRLQDQDDTEYGEKGIQLDDRSDTWSAKVGVVKPTPMRVQKKPEAIVSEV
jgi:hypothetical protein